MGYLANCSPSPFGEGRGEAVFSPLRPLKHYGDLAICSPSPFGEGWGEAVFVLPLPSERAGERLLSGVFQAVFSLKQKTPKGLGAALRGCFITRKDCLFRQKRESVTVLRGGETKSLYASPCFNHLKRSHYLIEKFHIKHLHIGVNLDVLVVAFQHEYWVIALVFRVESTQCMGKGSTSEVVIVNTSC